MVANYFHAQGIPLADFSRSGAQENKRDRAELARLIERFKLPVGCLWVAVRTGSTDLIFRKHHVSGRRLVEARPRAICRSDISFGGREAFV
jgi:hypothetical protein